MAPRRLGDLAGIDRLIAHKRLSLLHLALSPSECQENLANR
jgi:hypothetical protein